MDKTELIFSGSIAILYPFFFSKLVNQISGYNEVNKMCDEIKPNFITMTSENIDSKDKEKTYETCNKNRNAQLDKIDFNKHLMLLAIAMITIITSSMIKTNSTKLGVGLGGIFTLLFALMVYWRNYGETTRIIISGLSLLIVILFSIRLYKIKNIADIFSIEFGTK